MKTKNLWHILNDCEKYGSEPQTFCREIVLAAIEELKELESRPTKRAVDVKPAPLILCPDCNLYHDKNKTRCTIPASRN